MPFLTVAFVLSGLPAFALEYWLRGAMVGEPELDFVLSWQFWGPILGGILVTLRRERGVQGTLIAATIRHLSGRPVDIGHSVYGRARPGSSRSFSYPSSSGSRSRSGCCC